MMSCLSFVLSSDLFSGSIYLSLIDFYESLFDNTNLTGSDFSKAINYNIDINRNIIRKATFSRFEAIRLLYGLEIKLVN